MTEAEPREGGPGAQPEASGDLAHLLALADEEQDDALLGPDEAELLQEIARLDRPVGGRRVLRGGDAVRVREGHRPASGRPCYRHELARPSGSRPSSRPMAS